MSEIQFSSIITSYNQREFIKDAVDSALCLRSTNKEIIVVDDGSSDGSQDVLRGYGDAIRLVALEANRGKGAARNCGASLATGEYLLFLDGDDAFLPWALQVYDRIVQAKRPQLILAKMLWFEGMLTQAQPADDPRKMEIVDYGDYLRKDRPFGLSASSLVIQRQLFQSVGGWAKDLLVMEDRDLVIRLADAGRTVQLLSPPTVLHRRHAAQSIHQVSAFIGVLNNLILKERLGQYPGSEARQFERSALLGGVASFWAKKALLAGLYWDAVKLLARAWPMLLAAITRKLSVILKGRRPCETIEM
ncbi:MAG: glycosyltransferase [Terriglobia bacterium]|jgi:glycosyltransferase involved in cell wall biosynthesis